MLNQRLWMHFWNLLVVNNLRWFLQNFLLKIVFSNFFESDRPIFLVLFQSFKLSVIQLNDIAVTYAFNRKEDWMFKKIFIYNIKYLLIITTLNPQKYLVVCLYHVIYMQSCFSNLFILSPKTIFPVVRNNWWKRIDKSFTWNSIS